MMMNTNNQYLAYLKTEIGSHLYRMVDKDRSNNYYNNQEKQFIKSVEIDNFFDFYLNTLKFTPKELVESLGGRESNLVEIFYSTHYQKFEQRKSWINNFKEEIKNNTENLFFLSFQECLKNHGSYLDNHYDTPEIKDYYIKENFALFKDLVSIGKEKGYFTNKNESYFHTLNKLYKDHLEQENIFNPQFNFTQLKQELTNHNPKNGSALQTYIHTYISDISELFKGKSYIVEELAEKKLLPLLIKHICLTQDPEVKKIQTDFFDKMIHNQFIREAIIDENSSKKEFVSNFPTLIHPYLMSLEESEKIKLFNNLGYKYDNLDKSSFGNSSISSLTNLMIHDANPINLKSASFIIENLISYNKDLDKKDLKSYVGNIALHCIAKSVKDQTTSQSAENIIFIDKYSNYFKHILKDDDSNKEFLTKVNHIKSLLEYTQNSYPETYKKINLNFKNQFEKVINQTWQADSYQMKEKILNTSFLLKNFTQYDLLDSINKNNLELNKIYSYNIDSSGNKSKKVYDFPLIFTLFEKNPDIVMPWILKTDNIDKIKEIKYKNKNIVEYFADSDHINLILEHLTKDDQAFKKLILDNKKVLKKMSNHENQALKIATTFHSMSIKLEEKEVQSVKRKI